MKLLDELTSYELRACICAGLLARKAWPCRQNRPGRPRKACPCRQNDLASSIDLLEKHAPVDKTALGSLEKHGPVDKTTSQARSSCSKSMALCSETPWLARSTLLRPGRLEKRGPAQQNALAASICLPCAALGALVGSIWLPWAPWLARFGCLGRSWAPWLARFGCPGRSWTHWLARFGCKRMPYRMPQRRD